MIIKTKIFEELGCILPEGPFAIPEEFEINPTNEVEIDLNFEFRFDVKTGKVITKVKLIQRRSDEKITEIIDKKHLTKEEKHYIIN